MFLISHSFLGVRNPRVVSLGVLAHGLSQCSRQAVGLGLYGNLIDWASLCDCGQSWGFDTERKPKLRGPFVASFKG